MIVCRSDSEDARINTRYRFGLMLRSYKSEKGVPFDRKWQTRDYLFGREIPADDQRKVQTQDFVES